ncbi:hypothetical protein XBO1_1050003 [Xenorhabdus bovienii str. oregonense]|uniref:Uncharacterized protein n=1 Tax=Xenorhabdus bovienii str. oregonense TaxID=1398202 RepID=A0A077P2W7_XENBV|nr:hypothetical protein XBO1_1050003 [Xenorhabdus bovienii str. oregonense]
MNRTFCECIKVISESSAETIKHFMDGNKVSATHVPMGLFSHHGEVDKVDHHMIQGSNRSLLYIFINVVAGINQVGSVGADEFCCTHNDAPLMPNNELSHWMK